MLPALKMNVSQAARELGVSRQLLHRIPAGQAAVTPEMAVRLGKWAGNGPHLWLSMQHAYDVWHAERALARRSSRFQHTRRERGGHPALATLTRR